MQRRSLTGTDAILFDLDGTLWDSAPSVSGSWQRALQRFAPELRPPITADEVRSCMGMRIDELGCRLFPMLDDDARAELLSQCLMEEDAALRQEGGILFPAVLETLAELHKTYKLCVVSNCQCGYIENFLRLSGLANLFHDHICFGDTGRSKGENARQIILRNHFQQACFVGDTPIDGRAAREADIPFIFARYGFGSTTDFDYAIDSFDELLYLL